MPPPLQRRLLQLFALLAVLLLAGWARLHQLDRTDTRADELNMLNYANGAKTITELWTDPPWLNQIPFADSIPVVWSRLFPNRTADEAFTREPFALFGLATVGLCTLWMLKRRGIGAGLLLGLWLAILPYHVYHSREAYYYVVLMFFSAGMTLRAADLLASLRARAAPLRLRHVIEWTIWTLLACLTHMGVWMLAGIVWLLLLVAGWRALPAPARRQHAAQLGAAAVILAIGMSRWVYRAILEMQRTATDPMGHIGVAASFVAPRVLPVFVGGANAFGIALLLLLALAAGRLAWTGHRRRPAGAPPPDALYRAVSLINWLGLLGTFLYVFGASGGEKGKLVYFSPNLPVFLAWAAMTLDRALGTLLPRARAALDAAIGAGLVAALLLPVLHIQNLDGKPTPYRKLQAWFDTQLAPGDVIIVDRWLEPWNEMARYAPTNTTVTFTVPDEPFEQHQALNWRQRTRAHFEQNKAQAFLRLARNHEERIGLWTWPEKGHFARHAIVTNTSGIWLRDTGFAPMEEFHTLQGRLLPEIFYNTRDDLAQRASNAGQPAIALFSSGWTHFKPWQQGDFSDYRILQGATARLELHNLTPEPAPFTLEITAAAPDRPAALQVGNQPAQTYPAGQLTRHAYTLDLDPGPNTIACHLPPGQTLFVRELHIRR
ncbi:MAG: hypothetical protein GX803_05790 [Lentisphaerae bacterium]|jgi:hypothetical protein|nr:hypothetical protein [Lentisphaerota bacterium]